MRLQELFLIETSEEDRAVISLANAIYSYIQKFIPKKKPISMPSDDDDEFGQEDLSKYSKDIDKIDIKPKTLGKIGDLFDTPLTILNPVKIRLETPDGLLKELPMKDRKDIKKNGGNLYGMWDGEKKTILLNIEHITSGEIKTKIAHELRHALDDFKSKFRANTSTRYATPKKKEYQLKHDPELKAYQAQPREINARFTEVLHYLVSAIDRLVNSDLQPEYMRWRLLKDIQEAFTMYDISKFFPEKEKSKDYKRLMKRAVDFAQKEFLHKMKEKQKS
jgi:hypothetical protein